MTPLSEQLLQVWEYRETATTVAQPAEAPEPAPAAPPALLALPGLSEEEVAGRVSAAVADAERRWTLRAEQLEERRQEQLQVALQGFATERAKYYRAAETEVVHLALAIARKILAREASMDPDLLHALVRIALDRMGAGAAVKVRVAPANLAGWQRQAVLAGPAYLCDLVADPSLVPGDCVVETDLGVANLGLEAQCKEVEQSMLDLLDLRPVVHAQNGTAIFAGTATEGRC